MSPEILTLTGSETINQPMIEFALKPDISPQQIELAVMGFNDSFNAPLDQKKYELLMNANEQHGPLGNLMDLFSNGKEIRQQLDILAFDNKESLDSLPIEKKVAVYTSLECMMDDLLQKQVFKGKQRDQIYDLKVDLRQIEKQLIKRWVEKGNSDEILPMFGKPHLTRRQFLNLSVNVVAALALTACNSGGEVTATKIVTEFAASQTPITETFSTNTPEPTLTNTPEPTPTKNSSPEANLPAEWVDRIERVETMIDMEGKRRIVAIQKSDNPEAESKLRVLQWDAQSKEWINYQPQVGKYGHSTWWDRVQVDDLPVVEIQARMNQELIYGKDGQEIKPGLVADLSDYTIMCGDIVDFDFFYTADGDQLTNTNLVVAVPLSSGDITLIYIDGSSPDRPSTISIGVRQLESVDPIALWEQRSTLELLSRNEVFEKFSLLVQNQVYWRHLTEMTRTHPYRRIVFGVDKKTSDNQEGMRMLVTGITVDRELIRFVLSNATFMSAEEFDSIKR